MYYNKINIRVKIKVQQNVISEKLLCWRYIFQLNKLRKYKFREIYLLLLNSIDIS